MKKIYAPLVMLLLAATASKANDSTFVINGNFDNLKSGKIYLIINSADKSSRDSAEIKNGHFTFTGTAKNPANAALVLKDKRNDYFPFFVEPVKFEIHGTGDSLKLLTVKGSRFNDDDAMLKSVMKSATDWEEKNGKIYEEANKVKNKKVMDSLDEVDMEILKVKRQAVVSFIKDHPDALRGAMAILENYAYYAEATDVEPAYKLLSTAIRNSETGLKVKKLLDTYKTVAIGNVAPDISQITPGGKSMNLSSLKGKYVLVDFWASWCGPCRKENPNIVKTYNQYHSKGFEIFAVSYDTKKDRWEKAIKDDSLNWNQVSDLQGWKNSTSDQYGIKAIPANLLLDKEGRIVAKNLFGQKLSDKVAELVK